MTTRHTTRRAILAGAAALPAFVVPTSGALASRHTTIPPQLVARYAAIFQRWKLQSEEDNAERAIFDKRLAEVSGHPLGYRPRYVSQAEHDKWDVFFWQVQAEQRAEQPVDDDPDYSPWDEIHDELYLVCRQILEQPARTVADLGLQAQAFALMRQDVWTTSDRTDFKDDIRSLIGSVCRLAGVEPLPGVETVEITAIEDDGEEVQS